jgi:hypothetical protein
MVIWVTVMPFVSRSATMAPGRTAAARFAASWLRYTSWPVLVPEPVWSTSRPLGSMRALAGSRITTVPTTRLHPDRSSAVAPSFSTVTVLSAGPGCTATRRSAVTLADVAGDGLADATAGDALTIACNDGEATTEAVGTTPASDGLATATGDALLLPATDGDALTAGGEDGLGAGVGAVDWVAAAGAAVVHAAVDKMTPKPMTTIVG